MHTPGIGVVWGSGLGSCVGPRPHALLPTKTSRFCIQSSGSVHVFLRTFSQVDFTLLIVVLSRFIIVAMILSSVSLLFMFFVHLVVISLVSWVFPWITRSHLSTHTKWADSVMRICSSRAAPAEVCGLRFPSSFMFGRSLFWMLPHPRIIPSEISGHRGFSRGQWFFAIIQIVRVGAALQWMRMWLIDSGALHVWQFCLSSYPGMCVQKLPIFWVSCIALYRNCRTFDLIVGFCRPLQIVLFVSSFPVYLAIASRVSSKLFAVAGLVYGPLFSSMPLYAVACVSVANLAPCRSNSFGISRFSSSGATLFAPSLANLSLSSFPSMPLCPFTH